MFLHRNNPLEFETISIEQQSLFQNTSKLVCGQGTIDLCSPVTIFGRYFNWGYRI